MKVMATATPVPLPGSASGTTWMSKQSMCAGPPAQATCSKSSGLLFLLDLVDRRTELHRPIGDFQVLEGPADVAHRQAEQTPGGGGDHGHRAAAVDHDHGRRHGVGGESPGPAGSSAGIPTASYPPPSLMTESRSRRSFDTFEKTRRFRSSGVKRLPCARSISALPRNERATVLQGEVEAVHDPGLRFGVEVHQRVAAGQHIDVGDRGGVDEVVATEDHRPAEVLAEDEVGPETFEVGPQQGLRQPRHCLGAVGGVAGDVQRRLVDVGAVDLHPPAHLVDPEQFGQQDRQGVGLLPGGTAGAPHPDRLG